MCFQRYKWYVIIPTVVIVIIVVIVVIIVTATKKMTPENEETTSEARRLSTKRALRESWAGKGAGKQRQVWKKAIEVRGRQRLRAR
jgi:uncharacterized membrane protein